MPTSDCGATVNSSGDSGQRIGQQTTAVGGRDVGHRDLGSLLRGSDRRLLKRGRLRPPAVAVVDEAPIYVGVGRDGALDFRGAVGEHLAGGEDADVEGAACL